MTTRRDAREKVVESLFELEFNDAELDELLQRLETSAGLDARNLDFARDLIRGVVAHRDAIDAVLREYSENWDLSRMGSVDLSVLRMATYELLYREDIPPGATLNEAVDLAKFYSSPKSGRFVNGLLDRIRREKRPRSSGEGEPVTTEDS